MKRSEAVSAVIKSGAAAEQHAAAVREQVLGASRTASKVAKIGAQHAAVGALCSYAYARMFVKTLFSK